MTHNLAKAQQFWVAKQLKCYLTWLGSYSKFTEAQLGPNWNQTPTKPQVSKGQEDRDHCILLKGREDITWSNKQLMHFVEDAESQMHIIGMAFES